MSQGEKFDFTKAIAEIEEINRWFQNENVNLDEGLVKFRRGLELIRKCQGRLKEVENEFIEIKKDYGAGKPDNQSAIKEPDSNGIPF